MMPEEQLGQSIEMLRGVAVHVRGQQGKWLDNEAPRRSPAQEGEQAGRVGQHFAQARPYHRGLTGGRAQVLGMSGETRPVAPRAGQPQGLRIRRVWAESRANHKQAGT